MRYLTVVEAVQLDRRGGKSIATADRALAEFRDRKLDALVARLLLRDSLALSRFASAKRRMLETTAVYAVLLLQPMVGGSEA